MGNKLRHDIRSNRAAVISSRYDALPHACLSAPALVISIFAITTQSACMLPVPLAVFPEIEPGSGSKIEIYDQDGQPIQTEGLLIVHRDYWLAGLKGAPSNSLVPIRDGKATVPFEVAIGSTWLLVGFAPYSTLLIWVPCAFVSSESGVGSPTAIILVPGFNVETCSWTTPDNNKPSKVVLRSKPTSKARSWEQVYRCLRQRFEKRNPKLSWDLRFDHYHYWKVHRFIEAELARLQDEPIAVPPKTTTTRPAERADHN